MLGFNVDFDNTNNPILTEPSPIIGYESWGVHSGLDSNYIYDTLNFQYYNGCIVTTLESFNGNTMGRYYWDRSIRRAGQGNISEFIYAGATGGTCHPWEPYLYPIDNLAYTYPAYAVGYSIVDAMYQGMQNLAWQNVVLGDPLCTIAWGKQIIKHSTSIAGSNLVTDTVSIAFADTLTIRSNATMNFRIHGLIVGGYNLVVQNNVTIASDSWQRALVLANDQNHPELVWSTNPSMSPITFYKVYRRLGGNGGQWQMVDSLNQTHWTDTTLVYVNPNGLTGVQVDYYIVSGNSNSLSGESNIVTARVDKSSMHKETAQGQNTVHSYSLSQNYPNPFNPTTTIRYSLRSAGFVSLRVYDILGREVKNLVNENQTAGEHSVYFDASNLPSGVYIYRLQSGSFVSAKKMILIK
jgi:Secretion system C-terminal sorting domain